MKIIDIGVCIDNNDPKGMGRIRCVDYDDYVELLGDFDFAEGELEMITQ